MTEKAYVTLVATDIYAAGALVLAHRLRDMGSTHDLVCLVTEDISTTVLEHLSQLYKVVRVDTLTSTDADNLALLGRPELNITFTKLHLWNLTEYKKLVFLDADTLPLQNIDNLFDRPNFSAAPDAGWPDCFNSGVFVTEPSETDYHGLKKMAKEQGSFDGGDQGLLNTYFKSWSTSSSDHRLPFTYNTTPTSQYSYAPAHQYYVNNIAICHFIGLEKPWKYQRLADGNVLSHGWKGLTDLVQSWWDTWNLYYGQNQPHLLLSRSPKDTLLYSHSTLPVKLFSHPIANAWDTPDITNDIELYEQLRHTDSMPPIANITISTPKWVSQDVHTTHPYPISSESHTLDSYFDDASQYSSVDCGDRGSDYIAPNTDEIYDYQENTQPEQKDNNNHAVYQTIEWNPACESPPNTGMAANIPDLSSFVNAWDQPFQDQPIWIAPEQQPIPQMDYDYGFIHENQHHHEQQFHETNEHQEQNHFRSVFPWEQPVQQTPNTMRFSVEEQSHMISTNDGESQTINQHKEDSSHHHHQYHHHDEGASDSRPRGYHQYEAHHHDSSESQDAEQTYTHNEYQQVESETPTYAMDLMTTSTRSPGRSPRASMYFGASDDNQQSEYDWSDRDLIPIQLKRSSKLNIEGLSPSLPQSPIGSRRGSISRSRRSSISSVGRHRTTTAPSSPSGASTPIKNGPHTAQMDYSLYSRQPTSLFAQEHIYYSNKKTPYTSAATTPVREKMSFFCDTDEQEDFDTYQENDRIDDFLLDYSFDEPLMMASVTDRDYRQRLFGEQLEWNPQEALDRLKDTSETIMRSYGQHQQEEQPVAEEVALDVDESTVSRRDSRNNKKTSSDTQYALDAITLSTSPQEDRPFYFSGSSSPRTPVVRGLDSNLTDEIEAAREQHRQHQRAALSLQQPHTALATLLEAELDLSKSTLFNRRHDHNLNSGSSYLANDEPSSSSTREIHHYHGSTGYDYSSAMGTPMNQEARTLYDDNEDHNAAYFDASIIETARRKLNALTQDVSVTSMSSTATVNENYDDETEESSFSYGASLQNLSRYSFPPVLYQHTTYHMESAADTTFEERDPLELASSSSSTLQETIDHHSSEELDHPPEELNQPIEEVETSFLVQRLDEGYDRMSVTVDDNEESEPYDQISISVEDDESSTDRNYERVLISVDEDKTSASDNYDRVSISVGDEEQTTTSAGLSYERISISVGDDEEGYWQNDNDHTISTWLTLTSSSMMDSTNDSDNNTMERSISQGSSCGSFDENNDIITSVIAYITEEEEESVERSVAIQTPTIVELDVASHSALDSSETEYTTSAVFVTASSPTELSTSAVAMIPSIRELAVAVSDNSSDVAFLSAVDGTLSPSGSSSLCSSSDWHTVHSSTPHPNDSDEEYGEGDHEAALSLLEINTNDRTETVDYATLSTSEVVSSTPVDPDFSYVDNHNISDSVSVESDLTETGKD